jgi:leucyl aminopeptidase
MQDRVSIEFAPLAAPLQPVTVVLAGQDLAFGSRARDLNTKSGSALLKAAEAAEFKGKAKTSIELLAPAGLALKRLVVVGAGAPDQMKELDWVNLGGYAAGQIVARPAEAASLIAQLPDANQRPASELAADLAFGAMLRSYRFTKYATAAEDKDNNGNGRREKLARLVIHVAEPEAARAAFARRQAVANGVLLARDLVNEPANVLGPVEFAERVAALAGAGLEVEILDVEALKALKMNALLAVGQGSERPSRVAVMQWHGAKSKRTRPLAFIGKGVCFDTGGISMKPAQGMEDMKGDMGGAACVTGLMLALAERRAAVNAVGVIGLVENMPSGRAQRPGDIVTSMSGKTIEVLNTDAEGRLVLADILWYAQERFKPRFAVDLATLTGAIIVALGKEYAGLFSNDDRLAAELVEAGNVTGELVWRMPLSRAYDKLLDSRVADMKNIGGRFGGAITGAQFIQRFVRDTPWAHIDIAGVAMDSVKNDINQSWGSGWGVRLLDRLVADKYEKNDAADRSERK